MAYTTIDKPTDYFNTKLYTGNGSTGHAITGVGFQPDWVWLKNRDATNPHSLHDSVRGSSKYLTSNGTDAEATSTNRIESFDSDGFTLGSDGNINFNTENFVSWNWLAGGTASSNTDGSITSSVSANTTSGFSIVSYTGTGSSATVGHGLGEVPAMIFTKNRSSAVDWNGLHKSLTGTNGIFLNTTSASTSSSVFWNNTNPTSSVFTVNTSNTTNTSGDNYIAYCFAEKKGYSKFGSYTGNGNADGTFVYTGFKPAMIINKPSNSDNPWNILDNKRDTDNVVRNYLQPNSNLAEQSVDYVDFLSNGFKLRYGGASPNASGDTIIYMAFAESPFVTSTGIPTTAR